MAKGTKKTAKKEVVIDNNSVSDATHNVDVKIEVVKDNNIEEPVKEQPKAEEKVWVAKWEELVRVEGVNQTARGKQYYGVKRK